jgi:hypothetical protein
MDLDIEELSVSALFSTIIGAPAAVDKSVKHKT